MEQDEKTKEFIRKAKEIHGDTYDYSKVEYKNSKIPITIICKTHGEFLQRPHNHYYYNGCEICSQINKGNKKRDTIDNFIKKAIEKHGNEYDYSKVKYVNSQSKVIIVCKIHGDFLQIPSSHLQGCGCVICSTYKISNEKRKSIEAFIKEATEKHGNKYDYSNVKYINTHSRVIIKCNKHGDFLQTPISHLKSNGCEKCTRIADGIKKRDTTETFIKKAIEKYGDKYDYSNVVYETSNKKVSIICKEHGIFEQIPNAHLKQNGYGCGKCGKLSAGMKRKTILDDYIKNANLFHKNRYNYSKVIYVNAKTNIIVICEKHGEFSTNPDNHLKGSGCPFCVNKTEAKLYEKMKQIYPSLLTQFKQDWCKRIKHLPYDFCIPELKIIIELDGAQHFIQIMNWSSPEETQENDKFKEECANKNGYSIIRLLQEDVFYDTYDWLNILSETIEEIIKNKEITNIYLCQNDEYSNFTI